MRCRYKYLLCYKFDGGCASVVVSSRTKIMNFEKMAKALCEKYSYNQVAVTSFHLLSRI